MKIEEDPDHAPTRKKKSKRKIADLKPYLLLFTAQSQKESVEEQL